MLGYYSVALGRKLPERCVRNSDPLVCVAHHLNVELLIFFTGQLGDLTNNKAAAAAAA